MKDIDISIITPVYNNERYVRNAVSSVMEQNCSNVEIILIDDGSTDHTPQILDEIAMQYNRVTVIHQENQWIYASFNNGIRHASGEYIYILNSDDKFVKGALQLLSNKIREYDHPDVILTKVVCHKCDSSQRITEANVGVWKDIVLKEKYYSNAKQVSEVWIDFMKNGLVRNQANLYKRELALKYPFRNDVYGADSFFNIKLAPHIQTALVIAEPIYEYYEYDNHAMNASCGKYYGYEHEMFNEEYLSFLHLFRLWEIEENKYLPFIRQKRLRNLTIEIASFLSFQCKMTTNDKIKRIFKNYIDEVVVECSSNGHREELESRILSGLRNILTKETLEKNEEMYFIYEMLESLLRYEKEKEDFIKIEKAIYHPLNPYHIGKTFYEKLNKNA